MDMPQDPLGAIVNFGIGQPVPRAEDPTLVQGKGTYTDDVNLPNQAYAALLRSPHAHGRITRLDLTAAFAAQGVLAIYTADDLKEYGTFKNFIPAQNRDGSDAYPTPRRALAKDRVTFVGDPIACVVAATREEAQAAVETIELDIDPLPAVTTPREALVDQPLVFDETKRNVGLDFHFGRSEEVAKAFEKAAHVARLRLRNSRVVMNPMEPRVFIADYDKGSKRFTVYSGTQGVAGFKKNLAGLMRLDENAVRIISRNVGGSFGMKGGMFPEYVCVMHATRALGRPVKWTSSRAEAFLADHHGRDSDFDAELALDKDGHFLAVRLNGFGNLGAHLTGVGPLMPSGGTTRNLPGVYRTPLIEVSSLVMYTHTQPISAYRGAGRPEGNYFMERLVETAAAEMGIDPVEIRRRNLIPASALPFKAASGMTYDSGNFEGVLDRALKEADWAGFDKRKAESASRGKVRGRGIGQFLELTAPVGFELGGISFGEDGTVTMTTGTHDHGQGHWSTFAQILVHKLGVPFEAVRLMQSDSDKVSRGGGTGGSKSVMASGTAIWQAADVVIDKGKQVAAHMLEAAVDDIEFGNGRFTIAGTDRTISVMEIARRLNAGEVMPEGVPASLDVEQNSSALPPTFPNGVHICEVEVDPDTGVIEIAKYTAVNDFGRVINPMLVEGQLHGGITQGIGQCILEEARFDESGQLLTGSFMDYAMPRAENVPFFTVVSHPSLAKTNPLGIKGCGEAGCAGSLTSVMNAVNNALSSFGVRHIDMPATPLRVWEAIQAAKAGKAA
jgi:carbon-monoxide dehydrogenase large subunit